jgi:hypothetical protein
MNELIEKLTQKISADGKFIRGAISRVAEYCNVSHGTVTSWIKDGRNPNKKMFDVIKSFLESDTKLVAHQTGPVLGSKRPKKVAVSVVAVESVVEPVAV